MRHYRINSPAFDLDVWGNGFAYALTHKATLRSVYVQGEDATQFESDYESIEITFPHFTRDQISAYLWNEYEYGLAAN